MKAKQEYSFERNQVFEIIELVELLRLTLHRIDTSFSEEGDSKTEKIKRGLAIDLFMTELNVYEKLLKAKRILQQNFSEEVYKDGEDEILYELNQRGFKDWKIPYKASVEDIIEMIEKKEKEIFERANR